MLEFLWYEGGEAHRRVKTRKAGLQRLRERSVEDCDAVKPPLNQPELEALCLKEIAILIGHFEKSWKEPIASAWLTELRRGLYTPP
jgi:hypothetical protein